jgi:hypothetical protein
MTYVWWTVAAFITETIVVVLAWRIFGDHRWAHRGVWFLGIVAYVALVAFPALKADPGLERWIVVYVLLMPPVVGTFAKALQVGRKHNRPDRDADER